MLHGPRDLVWTFSFSFVPIELSNLSSCCVCLRRGVDLFRTSDWNRPDTPDSVHRVQIRFLRCFFYSDELLLLLLRPLPRRLPRNILISAPLSSDSKQKLNFFSNRKTKLLHFFSWRVCFVFFDQKKCFLRRENKFQYFFIIKSSNRFKKSVKYSIEVSQESVLSLRCASFEGCRECLFQKLLRRMMSMPSSSSSF